MNGPETHYPLPRPHPLSIHPDYARLRATCPVAPVSSPFGTAWLVTRYADVADVLADRRFSREALFDGSAAAADDGGILLNTDPPTHDRLRKLVIARTGAARVEPLRPQAEALAAALAARLRSASPIEFVSAFAEPFSQHILGLFVARLVELPEADEPKFVGWISRVVSLAVVPTEDRAAAFAALRGHLVDLAERRRADPGGDVLSTAPGETSAEEVLSVLFNVVLGGHAAVVAALGYCLLAALDVPGTLAGLAGQPDRVNELVEETLRLAPPGDRTLLRRTTEDVELGGRVLPPGAVVIPSIAAANRDADRPAGSAARHLAFGRGSHACLGVALARMELRAALGALAEHVPDLRLAVDAGTLRRTWEELSVSPLAGIPVRV